MGWYRVDELEVTSGGRGSKVEAKDGTGRQVEWKAGFCDGDELPLLRAAGGSVHNTQVCTAVGVRCRTASGSRAAAGAEELSRRLEGRSCRA